MLSKNPPRNRNAYALSARQRRAGPHEGSKPWAYKRRGKHQGSKADRFSDDD